LAILPIGAYCQIEIVWLLADLSIAMMLITNLVGVFGLSKEVIKEANEEFGPAKEIAPQLADK